MKRACCLIVIYLYITPVGARNYSQDIYISNINELYELFENDSLNTEEFLNLFELWQHPVLLNSADAGRFYELPGVNFDLALRMEQQRLHHGAYRSLADFALRNEIPEELQVQIKSFIVLGPSRLAAEEQPTLNNRLSVTSLYMTPLPRQLERKSPQGVQSFLQWDGQLDDIRWAGAITHRLRTAATYQNDSPYLKSLGPENRLEVEQFHLGSKTPQLEWMLGHYQAGFGQRLTFDTTTRQQPRGIYHSGNVQANHSTGRLAVTPQLFGGALQWSPGTALNPAITTTWFFSRRNLDVYQYDFHYGPDAWLSPKPLQNPCGNLGTQNNEFTCGADGRWYSSRVQASNSSNYYNFVTLQDAVRESLGGANFHWHQGALQAGLVAYRSQLEFLLNIPDPRFAPSAAYPDRNNLWGTGIYANWQQTSHRVATEISFSQAQGRGLYGLYVFHPPQRTELQWSVRDYNAYFQNPHGRGEAQSGEVEGLRQTNERGVKFMATTPSIYAGQRAQGAPILKWVTVADFWQEPYEHVLNPQQNFWRRRSTTPTHFFGQLRADFQWHSTHVLQAALEYTNKDLNENGRDETYLSSNATQPQGERRRLRLKTINQRIKPWRWTGEYVLTWEDVAKYPSRFDQQHNMNLQASYQDQQNQQWLFHLGYWRHPQLTTSTTPFHDRKQPKLNSYLSFSSATSRPLGWDFRMGWFYYADDRPEYADQSLQLKLSGWVKF